MKKIIVSLIVILALILTFGLTAAIAQVQPDDNMTPSDNTMAGDNWTPSENVQPPCGEVAPQPSGGCEGAPPCDNVTPPVPAPPPSDNVTPPEPTPPPTDNVTPPVPTPPPTDNVTPPAGPGTRVTITVAEPTDNVTPPTDNVTPPTDNETGQSVTLTITEENTGDVDLIGPLAYWGQMTANDVESIVRNPDDDTLTVSFADGPTVILDLATLQVPDAVVQEWLDSLESLVNNGNGTVTLNLMDGSSITVPLPDQLSLEQGIADMLEIVESIENNNDGTITINLSDGSSATISVTEIQDATIVTMFESVVNNGDGTFTLNLADGASFTTFNMDSPYVELYANDALVDVLDYAPDSGDDGDGILNPGETWSWTVNQTIDSNTTFVAIGHGLDDTGTDITYPDYPEERAEVTVPVGSPSGSGGMPTDGNATAGGDEESAPADTEPVVATSDTSNGWLSPLWIALMALGAIAVIAIPIGIIRARSRI
jgi:hypothetical protein